MRASDLAGAVCLAGVLNKNDDTRTRRDGSNSKYFW